MPELVKRQQIRVPTVATLKRYGMTAGDWRGMLKAQNGVCACCGKPPKNGWFNIDHVHVKGWKKMPPEERRLFVRGLICPFCNYCCVGRHITIERAKMVIVYLEAYEARRNGCERKSS